MQNKLGKGNPVCGLSNGRPYSSSRNVVQHCQAKDGKLSILENNLELVYKVPATSMRIISAASILRKTPLAD